jgi:glyoxylase-like metal-dependent hydrolase (beta-lactamase superfamily II)
VELEQVAPGLWRWTEPHPEWEEPEEDDSPADWPRDVGCVAYEADDALVLIDPLVGADSAALDELAAGKDRVAILLTLPFHERSRPTLLERYGATQEVPAGVEAFKVSGAGETVFWIPEHRALVPGDRILGDRPPGLRLCPQSWLRYLDGYTRDDLREELRPLLELPVELVLVSHGEPVLQDGRRELERALA